MRQLFSNNYFSIFGFKTLFLNRLPSFRGERDLTLGGNSKLNSASATDKGDVKPKREFKPTIPARRTKPQEAPLNVDRVTESPSNGRGRGRGRDDRGRGRGRGRPELIQVCFFK